MRDAVPYIRLSVKEEEKCLEMLRRANRLLQEWSELFGARKSREFRKMLFKAHVNPAMMADIEAKIPHDKLDCFRRERQFIIAIHATEYPDLGNRTVEYAMLCGYSSLARKHARRWFSFNGESGGMGLDDYTAEAYLCLLDAIYGFTKDDYTFSSFAWAVLRNRMSTATNKSNLLRPLTNPDLCLLTQYEAAKKKFNDHVTFDQVAEAMGLNHDQRLDLNGILMKVVTESQMAPPKDDGEQQGNDLSALRDTRLEEEQKIIKMDVDEAIENADLTDFERLVLDTSMTFDPETNEPPKGWMTKLALATINPNTGRPYTRMWVSLALQSAYQKIKRMLVA
jgi:hypothetical protein